jgi:hypothetical protein
MGGVHLNNKKSTIYLDVRLPLWFFVIDTNGRQWSVKTMQLLSTYHSFGSTSRKPLAKGLLAIFNWVI